MQRLASALDTLTIPFGTWMGVPLRAHWSWTIFMLLCLPQTTVCLTLLLAFFFVILHEYGHVLAARRCGIATEHVTLYPLGGVANMDIQQRRGGQEVFIALAGPLVNLVFAVIFITASIATFRAGWEATANTFSLLGYINTVLMVFNLVPAFPLDGGRILRGTLACILHYRLATVIAARCSQVVCCLLFVVALYNGLVMLAFISPLVCLAAQGEIWLVDQQLMFRTQVLPAFRSALAGDYAAALTTAASIEDIAYRRLAARALEMIQTAQRPELAQGLVTMLEGCPTGEAVRQALADVEIRALRYLNADVDKLMTAVEEGKNLAELAEIVEGLSDEHFKLECRKALERVTSRDGSGGE